MPNPLIPTGYEPLPRVAPRYDMSDNALRIATRRRQVRAVLIRGKLFVYVPDVEKLFEPVPYPPTAA